MKMHKRKLLNKIILLTYLLIAPFASLADIGNKQWTKECEKDNKKNCVIAINNQVSVSDSDKKQTLATAYIRLGSTIERKMDLVDGEEKTYKLKEENKLVPVIVVELPFNVNLTKSPLVQIDKKNIFNLPFSHCNAQDGCVATVAINDEIIKLLKAGKELTVITGVHGRKENLSINFPLKGFSKSYDSLLK